MNYIWYYVGYSRCGYTIIAIHNNNTYEQGPSDCVMMIPPIGWDY